MGILALIILSCTVAVSGAAIGCCMLFAWGAFRRLRSRRGGRWWY